MVTNATPMLARAVEIEDAIFKAGYRITDPESAHAAASEAKKLTDSDRLNVREVIMGDLAAVSEAQAWTEGEIKHAIVLYSRRVSNGDKNDKSLKTMATFVSELKNAVHPNVRAFFPDIVKVRDEAWEADEMREKGDQPVRKVWARKFHMLTRLLTFAVEEQYFDTVENVFELAKRLDPAHDAAAVARKLSTIRKQLEQFQVDFALGRDVDTIIGFLAEIDEDKIRAYRMERVAKLRGGENAHTEVVESSPVAKTVVSVPKITLKTTPKPVPTVMENNIVPDSTLDDLLGPALDMSVAA